MSFDADSKLTYEKICGKIVWVWYRKSRSTQGFAMGEMEQSDGTKNPFKGDLKGASLGTVYWLVGVWELDRQYGRQFVIKNRLDEPPRSNETDVIAA